MTIEENKAVVQSYIVPPQGFDELNRQIQNAPDPAAFIEKDSREFLGTLFSPDFILHSTQGDMFYEDFIQGNIMILTAFKDISYAVEDMIAEGDKVVVRYSFRGIHHAPMMGVPPTGKEIKGKGIMICKLAGGKIVEAWAISDELGMMRQLGAIPE